MDKTLRIVTMRDVKPEPVEWLWKVKSTRLSL